MNVKKNKILVLVLSFIGIICFLMGVSFAFINFVFQGNKEHKIDIKGISFSYEENDALNLTKLVPMSNSEGLSSGNTYTFNVSSSSFIAKEVPYYIYLTVDNENSLKNDYVRVNLVNETNSSVKGPIDINKLIKKQDDEFYIMGDKFVFDGVTNNLEHTYKLTIWINEKYEKSLDYSSSNNEQTTTIGGETFNFKINVATGEIPLSGAEMLVAKSNPESLDYNSATETQKLEMWTHSHPATSQTTALTDYRYIGSNPNNYITFNNEVWRIVGVFTVDDGTGVIEQRIKIVRNESIGIYTWDNKPNGTGSSTNDKGSNEWSDSLLQVVLNNGPYYNRGSGNCPYGKNAGTTACDFTTTGLTQEAKEHISNALYYLGGTEGPVDEPSNGLTSHFYSYERGNNVDPNHSINWSGEVGLLYPSDYGYATSGGITTNRSSCLGKELHYWNADGFSDCYNNNWLLNYYNWFITPSIGNGISAFVIDDTGSVRGAIVHSSLYIFPVVYLNSNVILEGTGSSTDRYTIIN